MRKDFFVFFFVLYIHMQRQLRMFESSSFGNYILNTTTSAKSARCRFPDIRAECTSGVSEWNTPNRRYGLVLSHMLRAPRDRRYHAVWQRPNCRRYSRDKSSTCPSVRPPTATIHSSLTRIPSVCYVLVRPLSSTGCNDRGYSRALTLPLLGRQLREWSMYQHVGIFESMCVFQLSSVRQDRLPIATRQIAFATRAHWRGEGGRRAGGQQAV